MVTWYEGMTLNDVERKIIERSLQLNGGNITQTAISLGISVKTVYNKIKRYQEESRKMAEEAEALAKKAKADTEYLRAKETDLPTGKSI
jgi:transposase